MNERATVEENALDSGTLFGSLTGDARQQVRAHCTSVRLPADGWLLRQGDTGDAMYILESGRLEVIVEDPLPPRVINVLRPGAALGELALLTGRPRVASVRALRDSELSRLDRGHFYELLRSDPSFAEALARTLAHLVERGTRAAAPVASSRVLAIVRLQDDLASTRTLDALRRSLERWGSVATLAEEPGRDLAAAGQDLDRFEGEHAHVLLVVGPAADRSWERFCLRQADRVLAISQPDLPSAVRGTSLLGCDLAVIQHESTGSRSVEAVVEALVPKRRHLVSMDDRLFTSDVERLARRLTGRSIGVVLSGGGARGLAHIGVLEVLVEAGVTIDRVGGCSMGAFVGALFAMGRSPKEIADVCRQELVLRKPFNDYTIPRVSLIRAQKAEAMMRRIFGEAHIDDLHLDYFCVSAEMLEAEVVVHRHGPLPEAVGASMSIPGLVPPLAHGGRLLVDGGVLNNLPIDVMAAAEEGPVIAVDVMSRRLATDASQRAAVRSGYRRWRPGRREESGSEHAALPRIVETLSRVTVLGSWRTAAENRSHATVVIAPEVSSIGLFEFERLDAAVEAGRRAARAALEDAPLLAGA